MSEFDSFEARSLSDVKAVLTTASALADGDPDEGDFGPGETYKGFPIVRPSTPVPAVHESLPSHFYVASPLGAYGLVPWVGSKIVWPWEAGWVQDLHRERVESLLKEPKKK